MRDIEEPAACGKQDAERLIAAEQIEYDPFIAISDLHLVRRTVPITFASLHQTVTELDAGLWTAIEASVSERSSSWNEFDRDRYAAGFAEGVAAVWEKIRDQVL